MVGLCVGPLRASSVLVGALCLLGGGCRQSPGPGLTGGGEDGGTSSAASTSNGADDASVTADDSSGTDGAPAPKYDVGGIPDAPPPPTNCESSKGGGGNGGPQFSFIWVANSGEGTVSKINTVTLEEVGRYRTHPVGGDPSRTSVNLNGDVAVANRNGGIVKFYANPANCSDANNDGQIQTSTGPDDVLAWDDEECRAWFSEFDYDSQRPVAWTPGVWSQTQCQYLDAKVWTSGASNFWGGKGGPDGGDGGGDGDDGGGEGGGDGGGGGGPAQGVDVVLLNGDTGVVEELVNIPSVQQDGFGLYGGAVDQAGNFFGTQLGGGTVVRVRLADMEVDTWPQTGGGYGMTVDRQGRLWTCDYQASRFDPATEIWDSVVIQGSGGAGCMVDADGVLWLGGDRLTGVDTDTMEIVATHPVDDGQGWTYLKGISVDFQGYVWAVTGEDRAHRVDPETGEFETVYGLVWPYTYSDMTGFALANAGGWTPAG